MIYAAAALAYIVIGIMSMYATMVRLAPKTTYKGEHRELKDQDLGNAILTGIFWPFALGIMLPIEKGFALLKAKAEAPRLPRAKVHD